MKQEKFSVPTLRLVSSLAGLVIFSLPVWVDGLSLNGHHVVILLSLMGSAVVSVTLVLILLSYPNELIHPYTSQLSYL